MVRVIAALASRLAIVGFARALGDAQCDASDVKCGESYLQRGQSVQNITADEGVEGISITHDEAYEKFPNMNCYRNGSGENIGDHTDGNTVESCAAKCDEESECDGYLLGNLETSWRRSGRCYLKKNIDLSKCDSAPDKWDMYKKVVPTPAPPPPTLAPTQGPMSKTYASSGIGMCRSAGNLFPSWGWAATTEQSAKEACDSEPTCSAYGFTASGRYQFYCSSSEPIGACSNSGNGGGPIVAGNGDKHKSACKLVETPEIAKEYYSKWMQVLPGDVITGQTYMKLGHCEDSFYDNKWNKYDAHAVGPQCRPPTAKGFPGVIVLPGYGGTKARQIMWQRLLAGRGIFAMGLDLCYEGGVYVDPAVKVALERALDWIKSDTWDATPYFGGLKFSVDPTDLTLMGYSGGGEAINNILYKYGTRDPIMEKIVLGETAFKNFISIAGVRSNHSNEIAKYHLNETFPNYMAIQADNDPVMNSAVPADTFVNRLKGYGLKAFLIRYQTGGHHPFKPSMFYEVSEFIKDPQNYQGVSYPMYRDGEVGAEWKGYADTKRACYGTKKSYGTLKPLKLMEAEVWPADNGKQVCQYYCLQVEGCVAYDLLDPKLSKSNAGRINCVLYGETCEPKGSRYTNWPSEFLARPYTGMASTSYCRKEGNEFDYKTYDHKQCDRASDNLDNGYFPKETSLSCASKCDAYTNAAGLNECTGFQVAVDGKTVGSCQLKKNIVIEICGKPGKHNDQAVYVKV